MNWLLKVGATMAVVAAVTLASVVLMVTLAKSSPARLVTPAELRPEKTAPTEGVELRVEREPPGTPETSPPQPERRERSPEDRRQDAPRRPTEPLLNPEPGLVRESTPNGPSVSPGELGSTSRPRRLYAPRREAAFTLTVEALGVYDVPVANAAGDAALDRGPIHLPDTQMPWDGGEQKNVYIAGHRLGYPGTDSRLLFYELDKLRAGDMVVLKGRGNVF